MSSMAPNVSGVSAPGRRTVYSMCGMCAVRCPIEVTVEDGRVAWIQGNPHDKAIGTSLCAKGAAGLSFEFDDQRPQSPLIRTGPRGSGQWRRASWDEALDYVADKLKETIEAFGGRGIALSDRGGPFNDLTRTFVQALGSPNYFNHDATCDANAHNAGRSIYGFGSAGLIFDLTNTKHLVLYGRNIVESLMVKEAKAFMGALANGNALSRTSIRARASRPARLPATGRCGRTATTRLNLAIIHEVLEQEAYDKDFVERFVTGMESLREAVRDTTPEWQEAHTGVPAGQLRAFVKEIAGQVPHVIFHPGWMTARHKQSFYVSRTALILNALMGNIEIPGGCVIAKPPEYYGRKSLKQLAARVPAVDGAARGRRRHHPAVSWDPAIGMLHRLFAAMETGQPYGIGAYIAYRHDPLTGMPDRGGDEARAGQAEAARLDRRALFGDRLVLRRHPSRIDLPRARQHPGSDARPGARLSHARPGDRARASTAARPGGSSARSCAAWTSRKRSTSRPSRRSGTTSSRAPASPSPRCARRASSSLADAPRLTPRDKLRFPTPSGKIEIESEVLKKAGLPSLPPYEPKVGADGRPLQPAVREDRDAGARPVPQQPAPQRDRAGTGALDPPRPRKAARHRRRRRGRGQRRRELRREASRPG